MDILKLIEKSCKPTDSQEDKFRSCTLARESEIFPDSYNAFSSSPDFMPSETTGIVVLSLPDTPPEHHDDSNLSEQNPNDLCAERLTGAEAMEATELRVPELGLDDEPEAKGLEVERGEESGGGAEAAEIKGGEIIVSPNLDAGGGDRGKTPKKVKKRKHSRIKTSENPRKLPPSFEGREKENDVVESSEKKIGFFEVLDIVKVLLGSGDGGGDSEDVNILETAKMMGVEFPIPRWWPSDDDDRQEFWY